jgi:hypothetical protein
MKKIICIGLIVVSCLYLSGCSVGTTSLGKEVSDMSGIQVGADRGIVELHLGSPIGFVTHENGKSACIYPIEVMNDSKKQITIYYDEKNRVTSVGTQPVETIQIANAVEPGHDDETIN